ncbi:sensor histidine kinase [Phytohabitans rumicis]|uniref:histidine kinase n=1 Tax=Phytohabitans rumicis TaxID=1076125 RepID=A0A6V8KXT9_9ACTN|nr:sensor histidine kinase [Phytohabitans rumicis]GFJ89912.1 histidine kinase [Phytohabitans rumicis]
MKGPWTLRKRVTALCVVIGGLLGLLAVVAAGTGAATRSQLDTLANQATPLRADSEQLLTRLVDQETAVRGFAVTGDPAELTPYTVGVEAEQELLNHMSVLAGEESGLQTKLRAVSELAASWRRDVAEPVIATVRSDGTTAGQGLINAVSRQRFDAVRQAVGALQDEIQVFRQEAADQARTSSNVLVALLIAATVIVVLGGIALLVSLRRLVIGPVTTLAEQVRLVSRGEYEHDIDSGGPPELAALARDVDAMRRQIAADLAEVRAARERVEWVNNQLQAQTEELMRSNRDLEQFAYVASHDLQEPLRKVASFCQLLQRRYAGQLDERADQYIAFAVDGAQRMQRLINDLLAFSRIGRATSGFVDVDLDAVMTDVAGQTDAARRYASGEVTWTGLPTVLGEEALLTTLLANLVGNSLKFRHPKRPPRVSISARKDGDEWEISCVDNGIGVEAEFSDKIFVIFQRLHAKDAYPGTGIGLAIAKKIVEYHGGRIWVDPDVSEGTTIRFTLPVAAALVAEPDRQDEVTAS